MAINRSSNNAHPLVREFIRRTFPRPERITFIDLIISAYSRFMGNHRIGGNEKINLPVLFHWTQSAELLVEAGKFQEAFNRLSESRDSFTASNLPGEFARAADLLFRNIDWHNATSYDHFDSVFRAFFKILVNLGKSDEYESWLLKYRDTITSKNSRYVSYCDLQCHKHWTKQQYQDAVKWGQEGKDLKDKSGADIKFGTEHSLALAQRDAGIIDPALSYLLEGRKLEEIIDPEEFGDQNSGPFYGNVGRCLHLMGQIDPALICYRKSAIRLQSEVYLHVENQGFIRKWIGELLLTKNDLCYARYFLEAAKQKWASVCPTRIPHLEETLDRIKHETLNCPTLSPSDTERFCVAWIYGRESDFKPS